MSTSDSRSGISVDEVTRLIIVMDGREAWRSRGCPSVSGKVMPMPKPSLWNIMEQRAPHPCRVAPRSRLKHRESVHRRLAGVLGVCVALASGAALAAPAPATAPSSREQRQVVAELLASYRPYGGGCTDSLGKCLEQKPVCPLAKRLERAITRMATAGLDKSTIKAALAQRQATMKADQPVATIVLDDRFRAGDAHAGATLAIYACPRQEACAKLIPELYREVTDGRLKAKAVLYYRPFFPPDNPEALECGRGLYAAAYQGKFWPYLLHLCLERKNLQRPTMRDWAGQHGLDRCIFDHTCEQPDTAAWLKASRKEGQANGVTAAPAVFLNGRRVYGIVDLENLVDLAEEEHERVVQASAKESTTSKPRARKPPRK
jgi:protein-disulfide isomerase